MMIFSDGVDNNREWFSPWTTGLDRISNASPSRDFPGWVNVDCAADLKLNAKAKADGPAKLNSRCYRVEDTWLRQP